MYIYTLQNDEMLKHLEAAIVKRLSIMNIYNVSFYERSTSELNIKFN